MKVLWISCNRNKSVLDATFISCTEQPEDWNDGDASSVVYCQARLVVRSKRHVPFNQNHVFLQHCSHCSANSENKSRENRSTSAVGGRWP